MIVFKFSRHTFRTCSYTRVPLAMLAYEARQFSPQLAHLFLTKLNDLGIRVTRSLKGRS